MAKEYSVEWKSSATGHVKQAAAANLSAARKEAAALKREGTRNVSIIVYDTVTKRAEKISVDSIKPNPAPRKTRISRTNITPEEYVKRPSQITRKAPTKRAQARRKTHLDAGLPPGYFPNPKPRFTQFVYDLQALNYGLGDWVTFGGANSLEVAEIMARAYADKRKVKVRVMDVTMPDFHADLK